MKLRIPKFSYEYPLLTKELIEQANRRQTYFVRVVYAAIQFTIFGAFLYSEVRGSGGAISPATALGRGSAAFYLVLVAQFLGIFLILPALIADVVTREREHQTIDLLLITQLKPTDIVLQKLLSRFIPMGTILLLSTPLIAVAYAYGGVNAQRLWSAAYIVFLTCFWAGAICMVLCIDARKTSTALLGCYVRLPMTFLVLSIISATLGAFLMACVSLVEYVVTYVFALSPWNLDYGWFAGVLVPPLMLFSVNAPPVWVVLLLSIPSWLLVYRYIRKARRLLLTSVFATGAGAGARPSFEIARVPDFRRDRPRSSTLPDERPVAWFELNSRTMRQLQKVFWFACVIDLPLLIYLASQFNLSYEDYERRQLEGFAFLTGAQWVVGAVVLGLMACSAFAPERHGRTLDVLLATPISTRRLLHEKLAPARKCTWLFYLPMAATILCEWWFEATSFTSFRGFTNESLTHLLAAAACLAVYPWLVVWLGLWLGMRIRDRTRAAVALLVIVMVWVYLIPVIVDTNLRLLTQNRAAAVFISEHPVLRDAIADAHLLSPGTLVRVSESGQWSQSLQGPPLLLIAVNTLLYLGLALLLRWWCLRKAADYLGRVADPSPRMRDAECGVRNEKAGAASSVS